MKLNRNQSLAEPAMPVMTRKITLPTQHAGKSRRTGPGTAFPSPLLRSFRFRCIYYDTLVPAMQYHFCTSDNKSRHVSCISRHRMPYFSSPNSYSRRYFVASCVFAMSRQRAGGVRQMPFLSPLIQIKYGQHALHGFSLTAFDKSEQPQARRRSPHWPRGKGLFISMDQDPSGKEI